MNRESKSNKTAQVHNDSRLQVNKRGGCLGYVIKSTNHLKFTKTVLLSREGTRMFKIEVKWPKNPILQVP